MSDEQAAACFNVDVDDYRRRGQEARLEAVDGGQR